MYRKPTQRQLDDRARKREAKRLLPLVDEPRDTEGPAGSYGCACVSRDARSCALLRYGVNGDPDCQRCDCLCHQWSDDDD